MKTETEKRIEAKWEKRMFNDMANIVRLQRDMTLGGAGSKIGKKEEENE